MTTEPTIDVASSSHQRMGIVARGFQILQKNAWQNSGRARMSGDALMGVAGVATGNPMLMVAGYRTSPSRHRLICARPEFCQAFFCKIWKPR
ncbi:MAG: hypothetical protein AAF213_08950, partial [Pseudomonadota bacterium]